MPQISQIDSFLSQIFWLFLAFGIIYLFISRLMAPKVIGTISKRENAIADDITIAENANNKAAKTQQDLDASLAKARSTAQKQVSDAEKEAKKNYDSNLKLAEQNFKAEIIAAESEVQKAKQQTISSLNNESIIFVEQILQKLAGISVKKDVIEKALGK